MREVAFIKQNAPKWEQFEQLIKSQASISPDELSDLYISLQDDLAYASTFYPKSNSTKYLNELTAHFHQAVYRNKRERTSRFISFWRYEVPYAVLKSHRQLLYALIIFVLAIVIGTVSSAGDDDFVRLILGDHYVNMTNDNIAKGDPMGVYKSIQSTGMFFAISTNNIRVSFIAYIGGIFFSLGSALLLFSNGIMVGAFQYLFYKKHLLGTCLLAIYLHGALELSAIVIAGGAGIVLGNSILFPGTYSRINSLTEAAKRSLKIVVGLVPVFAVAAMLESYVTRYYNVMPVYLRLSIIVISFSFIIWYFIIYPIQLKYKYHGGQISTA
jgi:uncharacterized membrane protein SpoIIM required for sporulation